MSANADRFADDFIRAYRLKTQRQGTPSQELMDEAYARICRNRSEGFIHTALEAFSRSSKGNLLQALDDAQRAAENKHRPQHERRDDDHQRPPMTLAGEYYDRLFWVTIVQDMAQMRNRWAGDKHRTNREDNLEDAIKFLARNGHHKPDRAPMPTSFDNLVQLLESNVSWI